jgi:NTE family protein
MSQAFRFLVTGLIYAGLTLCLSRYPAIAEVDASFNGLPAPVSSDQFVYVPLLDYQKINSTTDSQKHVPRVVLALGGGGMRGAAHVGVLKELLKAGIPIDGIAGTSMGSVVGGMYAAGMPVAEIERRFVNGSLMKSFVPIPLGIRLLIAPIISSPRLIGFRPYDGLYFGRPFHQYLEHALPADKKTIESLSIPYSAVAIDLCDGHPYAIRKGDLVSAMQASSAVPGLRKPIRIADKLFVDGGVLANLPVPQARELGGDFVIAVQIDERFNRKTPDNFRKPGSVAKRMINLQLAAFDAVHGRKADIVIHPCVAGVGLISTKISDAKRSVTAGEVATKDALPAIKEKLKALGIAVVTPDI